MSYIISLNPLFSKDNMHEEDFALSSRTEVLCVKFFLQANFSLKIGTHDYFESGKCHIPLTQGCLNGYQLLAGNLCLIFYSSEVILIIICYCFFPKTA